jgi:prepilin-type processing-associated H-X9-DG protein
MQSMNNIKQLMLGLIIAANEDKTGQYPQKVEDALKGIDGGDKTLINPRQPADRVGYVYVRPPDGLKADAQRLVIYEKFTNWEGVAVGFADGHVEFISDKAQFQKLLDTAKTAKAPDAK